MSSKTIYFCTLFNQNYLLKGVAMLRSLRQHCPEARVYVLCMDEQTQWLLERLELPHITCLPLAALEDAPLLAVKPGRSVAEYCWTLSSQLPWYILQNNPAVDFITYLDADLYFYSSLTPLLAEIGDASIAIIEHRFPPRLKHLEVNGRFCVEWVSFRRDEEGLACLARWREQCLEWCFYRLEEGRMGDQKYLDEWPTLYRRLCIIAHAGAGLAPWNYAQYAFSAVAGQAIQVNGAPLIFYHFHQLQLLANGGFERLSTFYTDERREPEAVYAAYEVALRRALADVRRLSPGFSAGLLSGFRLPMPAWLRAARRFARRCVATLR